MNRFLGLLATFFLFCPQICIAQNAAAKTDLISAIDQLSKLDVSLVGSIDEEVQEQPVAVEAGGPQRVVFRGMPFGATDEYRGDIEVLVLKNGELVIASKEEVPGIKVFKSVDEVLCLQVHLDEPLRTTRLISILSKLVDWSALGKAVDSATEIQTRLKGKDTEFRVVLEGSYIPMEIPFAVPGMPAGGAFAIAGRAMPAGAAVPNAAGNAQNVPIRIAANPMIPIIVEFAITFKMNNAKQIVGLEYALQYNDPMKGIMLQAVNAVGAGGVVEVNEKPAGEADLGKLILYDFDVAAKPSEKVTEFVNQAKTMLKNRK